MKQKQLHDYLETLGADGENDEYIKSQTNEENKNHLMSSDVLKVTTDV
jgi:hypothetical protein